MASEEEIEKLLENYQAVQDQLKSYALLLDQLQSQKEEIKQAKEEVSNSTGKIYVSIGGVLVETTKEKALADLDNKASMNELRITTATQQYNSLKAKEKELSEEIAEIYKQLKGQGAQ